MVDQKKSGLMAVAIAFALAVGPAFAMGDLPPRPPRDRDQAVTTAPEIDAGSGLTSAAVIVAALCLAWERRRRAA